MTKALLLSIPFLFTLGCDGGDDPMTRHQVCERMTAATCDRMTVCEPTVAEAGCVTETMARCCPDGVCAEAVVADEPHMAACEAALAAISCSDLVDRDLPEACEGLTDPLPMTGSGSGSGSGSDGGMDAPGDGVLEVSWTMIAGGTYLTCDQFGHTATIRIVATPPSGSAVTRDLPCAPGSALTTLPSGVYSIYAQARAAGGSVAQQTQATTVGVSPSGSAVDFDFTVTTSLGQVCQQLATTTCQACTPNDTSCVADFYAECCSSDGTCNRAALADPQRYPQCLSDLSSGQFCSTSPSSCAGVLSVY